MEATPPNNGEPQPVDPGDIDFASMIAPLDDVRANLNPQAAEPQPVAPAPEAPRPPEATAQTPPAPQAPAAPVLPNGARFAFDPTYNPAAPRTGRPATNPYAIPGIISLGSQGAASVPRVNLPPAAPSAATWVPARLPSTPESTPPPTPTPTPTPLPRPTPEATSGTPEHSRVAASASITETNRPTANIDGAEKVWDDNHSQATNTYEGLNRGDYVRESLVKRAVTEVTSSGAVLVEANGRPASGRLANAVANDYIAPKPADQDPRSPKVKMQSALEDMRARSANVATSTDADASFLAVEVVDEKVTIGAVGNVVLLTAAIGDPQKRVRYMPGVSPQGTRKQPENGLFMPVDQKTAGDVTAEVKVKQPVRFVGSSASFDLEAVRKHRPQAFADAFHQDTPNAAAAALRNLARDMFGDDPDHWDDRALFVLDVEPGTATPPTPVAVPTPAVAPTPAPAPIVVPPRPTTPPASPARPTRHGLPTTPNRILDRTGLRARVLLQDITMDYGGDVGNPDQELIADVETAYNEAFSAYVKSLAKRSDSSLSFNRARHNDVSFEFRRTLEARQVVSAIALDRHLEATTLMSEDERDLAITAQLTRSILGGNISLPSDPDISINVEGIISDIGNAVHKQRLQNAGWVEDASGNMVPPSQGLRKYTTKFVEKWAEWGAQGKRGFVKRTAVMAGGGLAVATVTALTAGAAGVTAPLLSGAGAAMAGTRVSRALIGTRLRKQSDILTQARSNRTDLVDRIKLDYGADQSNDSVLTGFNVDAERSKLRNAKRVLIGTIATLASGLGGELVHSLLDHAGDLVGGHAPQGISQPNSTPTGHPGTTPSGRPSTSPSARPSASASPRPSASASPTAETPSPSASANHPQATPTQTAPTARPTAGGSTEHTPGNGTDTAPKPGHGTGNGGETTPGNGGTSNAVELKVSGNNQTVSDVLSNAKGGSFSENWQTMLDSAKSAQAADQLRIIHLQNGNFYYQAMVNGHWTDNTTDVVKTLSKFSKGKFALAA